MHLLERPLRRLAGSRLVAAATWPHGIDGYTNLVAPSWSTDGVRAKVTGVTRQTDDTVTLTLAPNGNWRGSAAGQHVLLTVEVAGVRHSRCFSVASAAQDPTHGPGTIELTCKVSPTSVVARHLRSTAAIGDVVELSQAQGGFVLPAARAAGTALVLVSAGSGITPVLSMLRTLAAGDADLVGQVTFLHYARTGDDVLYGEELRRIEAAHPGVRVVVVTEHDATGDLAGRFEPAHLASAGIAPERSEAFVCGPAPFMDAIEAAWTSGGGLAERFHTERFGPAPRPAGAPTGAEAGGTLRFAASGIEVANDGRSILEQAEAAGLAPAHGCRMGICHTCVVPKSAGCTRDLVTGDLDEGPATGAPVAIRICVSAPVGDTAVQL